MEPKLLEWLRIKTSATVALLSVVGMFAVAGPACCADKNLPQASTKTSFEMDKNMKIRLTVNGKTLHATLDDNATAKDFLSLLPMTLTLDDYASTEKISYLSRKLSTTDAPAGIDPAPGDITYYAPWGNLAIFYRDFGYSDGLVKLGHIEGSIEALNVRGSLQVTIEADQK
jgi:hypothetical protein